MTDSAPTEIISEGAFKSIDAMRRLLVDAGLRADVIKPPGCDPNG